jgi:hypothetical protein
VLLRLKITSKSFFFSFSVQVSHFFMRLMKNYFSLLRSKRRLHLFLYSLFCFRKRLSAELALLMHLWDTHEPFVGNSFLANASGTNVVAVIARSPMSTSALELPHFF